MLIAHSAAADVSTDSSFLPTLEEWKKVFASGGVEACRTMMERKRDGWKSLSLNVAVTGNSGVGKSSFINAIRGLKSAEDKRAAEVDVKETTLEMRSYPHPDNPKLLFWDLPGVGTNQYPKASYLSDIKFDRYDFFLLMTADRFTENDTWLGKEIHKRNKKYFFVRSKIAVDISNNRRSHPQTHNEEDVIKKIRQATLKQLRENGCENMQMFLIDNYKPKKFDFEELKRRLVEDFPKLKKTALILSLQATSEEMIRLKKEKLLARACGMAVLAGVVAAVPVPGVSVGTNFAVVVAETGVYFTQLGLDEESLKRYAKFTPVDYSQLQSIVDRRLGRTGLNLDRIKDLLTRRGADLLEDAARLEFSRFIPIFGSYTVYQETYKALKVVIEETASVALEVDDAIIKCDSSSTGSSTGSESDDE